MKKFLAVILCFIWTQISFGQTNQTVQKGNYFPTTSADYFERVIKPWKYQYTKSQSVNASDTINKIGNIIFWRSDAIYDDVSKNYWKPSIDFDVYPDSDSSNIMKLSEKVKMLSSCDTINRGGDILMVGSFILFNASSCVNCASASNNDYCRDIIKRIFESVRDKDTDDRNEILSQFIIDKATFEK